ncbi:MAG: polysulfide reductase NrfD [Bacteroidales bacterium]|jgi:Ni/Fe-hydrogenase subunit HybB-like protein|nr:polysulfide reductase NrfD [Bacteroidales bacterium]
MNKLQNLYEALANVEGYIYPNEIALNWDLLIVMYPYITGLVAGAFILASLNRVFDIKALRPTYEISLLTALSFMLVATMPLISHLGQPFRFYEMLITPHLTSAMAIFGFVYIWYLMVVLLLEIWFDYRYDMVIWSEQKKGFMKFFYKALTLWVSDKSPESRKTDDKIGYFITVIGIPSAFLLHGYVGFIFGSLKANPWWSSVMMPVIFLFSAMVSGIALVMFIYMVINFIRRKKNDILCLDTIAKYLFYILILDFTLESLDQIHRIYEADESFDILKLLVHGKLFFTFFIMQIGVGTIFPLAVLGFFQFKQPSEKIRKILYLIVSSAVLIGIFFMRWNVVIGGQLFSKSFYGFTSYKVDLIGGKDVWLSLLWFIIPFFILAFLLWLLPPWKKAKHVEG